MNETSILQVVDLSSQVSALANNASALLNIESGHTYILYKIASSVPAWIRVYTSSDARNNDSSRSINQDPFNNSGVLAETVTTSTSLYTLFTPGVSGICLDNSISNNMFLSVTNLNGTTSNISITVTVLKITEVN